MKKEFHTPFFSVILCTCRIDDYFWQAVNSILQQTFDDFELIIISNGNDDLKSSFLAAGFTDNRVRFWHTNILQLTFNLNYGVNLAEGTYIVRMDADDIALPLRLERLFSCCSTISPDVVGSWAKVIDKDGHEISELTPPLTNARIRHRLPYRNPFIHPTVAIRKETLLRVGGYRGLEFAQDYDLWLRLSNDKSNIFMNIPEYLLGYRIHAQQAKGKNIAYSASLATLIIHFLMKPKLSIFIASCYQLFSFFISRYQLFISFVSRLL